ncbi:hypothetical protein JCM10207_001870 [Rhodosporidiobolus poonsookiae]
MPFFLRSSPSKRDIARPPTPPPPALGSPFQLSLSFAPPAARSDSSTSTEERKTASSSGSKTSGTDLTSPSDASSGSVAGWSVVEAPPASSPVEQREEKKLRKSKSSGDGSKGLKGLFRRTRSGSRSSTKSVKEVDLHIEDAPPFPSLPPTLNLALPSSTSCEVTAVKPQVEVNPQGLYTPPSDPDFALGEGDDLDSLLFLVHAAGDKALDGSDEREAYVPPSQPTSSAPSTVTSSSSFRTPPLTSSSTFSSPSTVSSSGPPTPKPSYSFLCRSIEPSTKKPALSALTSSATPRPSAAVTLSTVPRPSAADSDDDYGAASDEDSPARPSAWQIKPNSAFSRPPSESPLTSLPTPPRTPRDLSPSPALGPPAPSPRAASFARSPRRRPLGPRATQLLITTVGRLAPGPSALDAPASGLAAPSSTHPLSTTLAARTAQAPQPLGTTLGRLALLKKLKRGTTMLEAMELERPSSSSSTSYFDPRASVVSRSARLSILSQGDDAPLSPSAFETPERDGANGRRSLELWEAEHGRLEEGATVRRMLDAADASASSEGVQPVAAGSSSSSQTAGSAPLPRLEQWSARQLFPERMLETRLVEPAYGPPSIVIDVVRPSRVGLSGRSNGGLERSAWLRARLAHEASVAAGMGAALEADRRAVRPPREEKGAVGLLNSSGAGEETIPPALRAVAEGAARPPSLLPALDVRAPTGAGRRASKLPSGPRKLLLPGPLLLKALAEEGDEPPVEDAKLSEAKDAASSDEDDRPLFQLRQRASLLPPKRSPSRSPASSPFASHNALLRAHQKAAQLDAEVARLRARDAEAKQREGQLEREYLEREAAREVEVRQREAERRAREQKRRSEIMHRQAAADVASPKKDRRASAMPPSQSTPGLPYVFSTTPLGQQQQQLAVPVNPWAMPPTLAIPVPVPMPFYQAPGLSSSATDLQRLGAGSPLPSHLGHTSSLHPALAFSCTDTNPLAQFSASPAHRVDPRCTPPILPTAASPALTLHAPAGYRSPSRTGGGPLPRSQSAPYFARASSSSPRRPVSPSPGPAKTARAGGAAFLPGGAGGARRIAA